ncbi:unnamed protein product [Effrenium voratum]|uniref:Uncharacterized protein n=1 Tax=Effrenium voratum TaxID=2562239 RepID=A0AA36NMF2_9DINO|nr:unnamed protein product [Effrenium voratum]
MPPISQACVGFRPVVPLRPSSPTAMPLSQKAHARIQQTSASPPRNLQCRPQPYPAAFSLHASPLRRQEHTARAGRERGNATPRSQLREWLTQRIQAVQTEISEFQTTRLQPPSGSARTSPCRAAKAHASLAVPPRAARSASPPGLPQSLLKASSPGPRVSMARRPASSSPPRKDVKVTIAVTAAARFRGRRPSQTSLGEETAVRRLQRFIRRRRQVRREAAKREVTRATTMAGTAPRECEVVSLSDSPRVEVLQSARLEAPELEVEAVRLRMEVLHGRLACTHHAACRIQRAWRISQWRRSFVDFSRHQIGWLGSLSWLRRHHFLYGNELADSEDVRWWLKQRQEAPLDRQVDPWGFYMLQEHLSRSWQRPTRASRSSTRSGPTISGPSSRTKQSQAQLNASAKRVSAASTSSLHQATKLQDSKVHEIRRTCQVTNAMTWTQGGLQRAGRNSRLSHPCLFSSPPNSSSNPMRRCGSGPMVSRAHRTSQTILRSGSGPLLQRQR